jgi:hypothetical protein
MRNSEKVSPKQFSKDEILLIFIKDTGWESEFGNSHRLLKYYSMKNNCDIIK